MNKNIGDMIRSELIDYVIELQEENSGYERKIERLNNIINELEKWLNEEINNNVDGIKSFSGYQCKRALDKLNELKGDSSNE